MPARTSLRSNSSPTGLLVSMSVPLFASFEHICGSEVINAGDWSCYPFVAIVRAWSDISGYKPSRSEYFISAIPSLSAADAVSSWYIHALPLHAANVLLTVLSMHVRLRESSLWTATSLVVVLIYPLLHVTGPCRRYGLHDACYAWEAMSHSARTGRSHASAGCDVSRLFMSNGDSAANQKCIHVDTQLLSRGFGSSDVSEVCP